MAWMTTRCSQPCGGALLGAMSLLMLVRSAGANGLYPIDVVGNSNVSPKS